VSQGEGVTVAVLDTGCDLDHPDLADNLLPGYNFVSPKKKPWDDNEHGTHVTGIICALDNDIGTVGVAPKAKVLPVKVLDNKGDGNLLNVAKGIRWSVKHGADMLCLSLGAPRPIQQVRKAIQWAAKRGVPCFVAAGNAGRTKEVFYPAAYPEAISIGSIDEDLDRSDFSNTGKRLDFLAPGGKIFSTVPDNWYAFLSGTSMAAPFACGVAALLLSYVRKNTDLSIKTVEDYKKVLKAHTTPVRNRKIAGNRFFEGYGIIDPRKFLDSLDQS
jgi:subtilisin family serine protease